MKNHISSVHLKPPEKLNSATTRSVLLFGLMSLLIVFYSCGGQKESVSRVSEVQLQDSITHNKFSSHEEKIEYLQHLVSLEYDTSKYSIHFERLQSKKNTKVARLVNRTSRISEHVVFFDSSGKKIVKSVNISDENPYLHYVGRENTKGGIQQIIGYHNLINKDIDLEGKVPTELYAISKKENIYYSAVTVNVTGHISGKNHYIVGYEIYLMPAEEILQDVTVPGMSTVHIFNMDGELLYELRDLPYVAYAEVSPRGKYALLHHHKSIERDDYDPVPYEECVSIIDLSTKLENYKMCLKNNEIFIGTEYESSNLSYTYYLPRSPDIKNINRFFLDENHGYLIESSNVVQVVQKDQDRILLRMVDGSTEEWNINNNARLIDLTFQE